MKKKFNSICKRFNTSIINYTTFKIDMGVQCFDLLVKLNDSKNYSYTNGYFIGTKQKDIEQSLLLMNFESTLSDALKRLKQ